jgi:CheY-like chemotaxis protein
MVLDADQRIQTATQLVERIRECRREIAGGSAGAAADGKQAQPTIFLVESDEKLQDVLRMKLKEEGYRILIAANPIRALDRFRQQPFDLLVVDAATTDENGYYVFERIMEDAQRQNLPCRGILMLNPEQKEWRERMAEFDHVTVLIQPIKYRQLLKAIKDVFGESE